MIPGVTWTIAGRPVPVQDYSAGAEANLGYGQMRGILRASDARSLPTTVKQGAIIRGSTDNGRIFYQGRISGPPQIQRGLAVIAAQGEGVKLTKRFERRLYQSRDVSQWTDRSDPPYSDTGSSPDVRPTVQPGSITWAFESGQAASAGEYHGVRFWAPGTLVTRYAFRMLSTFTAANHVIRSHSLNGPNGSPTAVNDHPLALDTTVDSLASITSPGDALNLEFILTSGSGTWTSNFIRLIDVRVNGITRLDSYAGSEVMTDVGLSAGLDTTGVLATSVNILPLDWTQGSWADLLTYIANVEDRVWGVWEDNRLTYEPWGQQQWTAYQAWGAQVDLTQLEVWNGVTVKYKDVGGAGQDGRPMREVTVMADPDPLIGTGMINIWPVELADIQPDATVPTAVANILLPQVSSVRYVGRVETPHLFDSVGRDLPYEGKPGATLRVPDFTEGAMRIASIDYTRTGVSIGIEASASAFPTIRGAELERLRLPGIAELPAVEGPGSSGIPSEDEQYRQRFLPWPEPFKKPDWKKLR